MLLMIVCVNTTNLFVTNEFKIRQIFITLKFLILCIHLCIQKDSKLKFGIYYNLEYKKKHKYFVSHSTI